MLSARQYGAGIMVDLIGVGDKVARARRAEELGASYVCLHVGIDEQMKGGAAPVDVVRNVARAVSVPVAVAGGITSESAPELMAAGASIVIVGGAIIKDRDVTGATRRVKEAMSSGKGIAAEMSRKYAESELFVALSKASTCNIADAMHKAVMVASAPQRPWHQDGRPRSPFRPPGDWCKPVEAIDRAQEGRWSST